MVDDRFVIEVRVEPEQRQRETILPAGFPVTRTRIAAEAGKERLNIMLKGDCRILWRYELDAPTRFGASQRNHGNGHMNKRSFRE